MSRRVLIIAGAGAAMAVVAGVVLFVSGPASEPVQPAAAPTRAAAERARETPKAAAPREEPARPVPRPAAAEAPSAAPPAAAAPTTGVLRIESDVPDTSVFVDRVFLGTAPITAPNLAPGPHVVLLSPTGYESASETVEVTAGEEKTVSMSFKTVRLDASIAVVHKHAFGSCTGTLEATPQGLTYKTANRNDAFSVALADLETFEVDYLEKNMRVKIRGGKTYNFTDPDGNADRLFVFHRDVEKVRARIKAG